MFHNCTSFKPGSDCTLQGVGNNTSVQMLGTIFRWITIILVLIISIARVGDSDAKFSSSPTNWARMPLMFGMANSAFGCHEALPSLLFPIKQKRNNVKILAVTFLLIGLLFMLLTTTALTAFDGPDIADLYLLNFQVSLLSLFTVLSCRYLSLLRMWVADRSL